MEELTNQDKKDAKLLGKHLANTPPEFQAEVINSLAKTIRTKLLVSEANVYVYELARNLNTDGRFYSLAVMEGIAFAVNLKGITKFKSLLTSFYKLI